MRYLLFLSAFFGLSVRGQDPLFLLSWGVPPCAVFCIREGSKRTNCSEYDAHCVCNEGFVNSTLGIKQCITDQKPCTTDDLKKVDCAVNRACGAYQNNVVTDCSMPKVYSTLPATPLPHKDLSSASYTGIGVGCGVAACLTIGLLMFYISRRRKRDKRRKEAKEKRDDESSGQQKVHHVELAGRHILEADPYCMPQELEGSPTKSPTKT